MRKFSTENAFQEYVDKYLIPQKKTFVLIRDKSRQRVIWDVEKNYGGYWRKKLTDMEQKSMWIFAAVKKSCSQWLKKNGNVQELPKSYLGTVKDWEKIKNLASGEVFYATDINHCYWRVAFIEGYLNEKLYTRLVPPNNIELNDAEKEKWEVYKLFRNKSLACIKGVSESLHFVEGKYKKTEYKGDPQLDIMYSDIRNKAYAIMHGAKELCDKVGGFIMYKVDCVYYDEKCKDMVEAYLQSKNVFFKTHECVVVDNKHFIHKRSVRFF